MGEPKFHVLIQIIQILAPLECKFLAIVDWLAAAADTAARTGHNLYEVIVSLSRFNLIQKSPCVAEAAYHCGSHSDIVNGKFCLLDSVVLIEALTALNASAGGFSFLMI